MFKNCPRTVILLWWAGMPSAEVSMCVDILQYLHNVCKDGPWTTLQQCNELWPQALTQWRMCAGVGHRVVSWILIILYQHCHCCGRGCCTLWIKLIRHAVCVSCWRKVNVRKLGQWQRVKWYQSLALAKMFFVCCTGQRNVYILLICTFFVETQFGWMG